MTIPREDRSESPRRNGSLRRGLNPWWKLVLGIALLLAFFLVVAPLSKHLPGARRMGEIIDERNLRATAIYYTDLEETAEGSAAIRDSLEYPPTPPRP